MDVVHLRTGRVVTWGHPKYGGLCTRVAEQLRASMELPGRFVDSDVTAEHDVVDAMCFFSKCWYF